MTAIRAWMAEDTMCSGMERLEERIVLDAWGYDPDTTDGIQNWWWTGDDGSWVYVDIHEDGYDGLAYYAGTGTYDAWGGAWAWSDDGDGGGPNSDYDEYFYYDAGNDGILDYQQWFASDDWADSGGTWYSYGTDYYYVDTINGADQWGYVYYDLHDGEYHEEYWLQYFDDGADGSWNYLDMWYESYTYHSDVDYYLNTGTYYDYLYSDLYGATKLWGEVWYYYNDDSSAIFDWYEYVDVGYDGFWDYYYGEFESHYWGSTVDSDWEYDSQEMVMYAGEWRAWGYAEYDSWEDFGTYDYWEGYELGYVDNGADGVWEYGWIDTYWEYDSAEVWSWGGEYYEYAGFWNVWGYANSYELGSDGYWDYGHYEYWDDGWDGTIDWFEYYYSDYDEFGWLDIYETPWVTYEMYYWYEIPNP